MTENLLNYNYIGCNITTFNPDGSILHTGTVLGDTYDIKMKITSAKITHSNSSSTLGWTQGLVDVTGTLTVKSVPIIYQIVQDTLNGSLATVGLTGKLTTNATSVPTATLDGTKFTEYDNKLSGPGKETVVTLQFEAQVFTEELAQINVTST